MPVLEIILQCICPFLFVLLKYMKVRETCGPAQSVATVPVKSCPFWNTSRSSLSLYPHFLSSLFLSIASLQEESLTYEGLLDSLEAEILKARQERQNMQATYDAAQLSKETAKVIQTSRHACLSWRLRMIGSSLLLLLLIQVKWVTSKPTTAASPVFIQSLQIHYCLTKMYFDPLCYLPCFLPLLPPFPSPLPSRLPPRLSYSNWKNSSTRSARRESAL